MRDSLGPHATGLVPFAGRTVSRVGFGAMQLERLHEDRPAALRLLRRALELGVNHIDTAHFYGDGFVNDLIREAVRGQDVLIASKVGADPNPGGAVRLRAAQKPAELRASVEDNLRGLGVERIGVVYLRRADRGPGIVAEGDQLVPLEDQLEEMIALRTEGKIGAIALSSVDVDTLSRALPAGIAGVQNSYSLVSRESGGVLEVAAANGVAWVPFFPVGGAFPGFPKVSDNETVIAVASERGLTTTQVGLAWLLAHSSHTLLIPGTASVDHLEENVAAGSVVLSADELLRLDAAPGPLAL